MTLKVAQRRYTVPWNENPGSRNDVTQLLMAAPQRPQAAAVMASTWLHRPAGLISGLSRHVTRSGHAKTRRPLLVPSSVPSPPKFTTQVQLKVRPPFTAAK